MNDLVSSLHNMLVSENSIPNRLAMKEEVSEGELIDLIELTNKIVDFYKNEETIPKKLAACFIEIYNQFTFRDDFYSDEKLNRYEDIGIQMQELAFELFDT